MTPTEILADLSSDEPEPLREALESADGHRNELVEPLLRAIDCGLTDPSGASPEEATLFCYALYVPAKWRDPRAYPLDGVSNAAVSVRGVARGLSVY